MNHIFPWIPILGGLMSLSAFFSASEAAFFSLEAELLSTMRHGSSTERKISRLMDSSERLLSVMLFANLVVNMFFFSIVSVITLKIQSENAAFAGTFSMTALLTMIIFCELLPKAIALLIPQPVVHLAVFPLTGLLWLCRPVLPILTLGKDLSLRLFVPKFQSEPLLDLEDLEKAVSLAHGKRLSSPRDKAVLKSLLSLSEISAREIMRPRTMLPLFSKPVSLADLREADRSLGWIFIQESDTSDAIELALPMSHLVKIPPEDYGMLELHASPTLYVPWNQPTAVILDLMRKEKRTVAVVVDEYGSTPGVILLSDILESIFAPHSERVSQLTDRQAIQQISENQWEVSGLCSLRAFCRHFQIPLPDILETATVAGFLAHILQKLPEVGDLTAWQGLEIHVTRIEDPSLITLEVVKIPEENQLSPP